MQSQAKLNTWCSSSCVHCKIPEQFLLYGKTIDNICKNVRVAFGRFNTETVKTVAPELAPEQCFTAERMKKALKAMDICKKIIEYKKAE